MIKWNHYICQTCGAVTIARHDDEGVTPFMLGCYARAGCNGRAQSTFFRGPQGENQIPHVVFFRPTDAIEAIEAINKEPRRWRKAMLEHYQKGGALMRKADTNDAKPISASRNDERAQP